MPEPLNLLPGLETVPSENETGSLPSWVGYDVLTVKDPPFPATSSGVVPVKEAVNIPVREARTTASGLPLSGEAT